MSALPEFTVEQLSALSTQELLHLDRLQAQHQRSIETNKIDSYYPDEGPLRRELYKKHLEFFRLGADHKQRLVLAANRVGKTEGMGAFEVACHVTGIYPDWWEGYRYDHAPKVVWIAGTTAKDVRDAVQLKLLGPIHDLGTGLVRADCIGDYTNKSGVPNAIDTIQIKHVPTGKWVSITFKSYDQGRESFQAADVDLLWLDEEPPLSVYIEAVTRTMTTLGLVILTFTPLLGLSETVLQWLPNGELLELREESKAIITCTWDDVPHLTEQMKAEMLATYPPYQRDARSKGVPQLGAGAIYPVPESDFVIDPIPIPDYWPRAYALDVGWNRTAALWGAFDRESQTWYFYSEHYRGQAEPSVHASSIKSRGDWIPGVIDPASRGRSQDDGKQLLQMYRDQGLKLTEADNGVESGIYAVYERLSGGKIKVFRTLQSFLGEYRLYRRDEKGRIVKTNDHLMDDLRYIIASGLKRAIVKPVQVEEPAFFPTEFS